MADTQTIYRKKSSSGYLAYPTTPRSRSGEGGVSSRVFPVSPTIVFQLHAILQNLRVVSRIHTWDMITGLNWWTRGIFIR